MKVIIAEKPSVARDIAAVLDITGKKKGSIEGRGCAVTWAFGHLVTLQEPGEYDPALKRWSLETLPFVPEEFRLTLIKNRGVAEQFQIIEALCKEASEIICATDAGREGELIFRYILAQADCEAKPIRRLWLNSLTPEAIKEAFGALKDGHDYDALYAAARCRSESDWIVGLNATRYYTVKHGRIGGGSDRVLWSIGRVQTPVLAMIVERDDTILQFRPQPFWELASRYREVVFKYTGPRFDTPDTAQALLATIMDQPFTISAVAGKEKKEQPPQLFDLTTLQREVNKAHGLSAADTLAAAQNLYEKKLVTYPRTDSRYLSQDMQPRIPKILAQLKAIRPDDIAPLDLATLPFSKRIIDDSKVTDHHAIIPTGVRPSNLGANEQLIYEAVTTQFIAAFYPVCLKKITTVDGVSCAVKFQAKGTQVIEAGWTVLFAKKQQAQEATDDQTLPAFTQGESGPHAPFLHEGKTKPPSHFNENSLLGAMEAAGKLVEDDTLREALKERGIGTPATRAAIIETLLNRNYIRREKKQLRCTDMGRCLIALIQDPLLKSPEMTGEWEEKLKKIERDQLDPAAFMSGIGDYIRGLIKNSGAPGPDNGHWASCPLCGKEVIKGKRAYGCSGWQEGCPFVLEPEHKGVVLQPRQVQTLLRHRLLPQPIRIGDEPRLLILSTQGQPLDLRLPSADRQHKDTAAKAAAPGTDAAAAD
jgi:DNA topoisomerase-3